MDKRLDKKKQQHKAAQRPVYKDSAAWLEHAAILRKAGIDVYEEDRKAIRKLR